MTACIAHSGIEDRLDSIALSQTDIKLDIREIRTRLEVGFVSRDTMDTHIASLKSRINVYIGSLTSLLGIFGALLYYFVK